jgi:hypothetical protein
MTALILRYLQAEGVHLGHSDLPGVSATLTPKSSSAGRSSPWRKARKAPRLSIAWLSTALFASSAQDRHQNRLGLEGWLAETWHSPAIGRHYGIMRVTQLYCAGADGLPVEFLMLGGWIRVLLQWRDSETPCDDEMKVRRVQDHD